MTKQERHGREDRPLRILMIAPTSFFGDYGGHIRIFEETRILQAMGHRVAIVTYNKGSDLPGLDIRRTARLPWRAEYDVGSSRHKFAFDVYLAVQSLIEGMRFRPDVIHGHMHEGALIGGVLARLLRVPLVFDFQGSLTGEMSDHGFIDPDGRLFPWVRRVERYISGELPDAILTSSLRATELLRDEFEVPADLIHPLPDCADTIRFDPSKFTPEAKRQLRQRLGIPEAMPVVAYLGLLTNYQGTHHLIEAAAQLKQAGEEVHFLIMGYPNVHGYSALAEKRNVADRVTFTGKVKYRDAPYYLSLGDIAAAPKLSSTEGSGKLLNYMAMAQPVVAYETPVHREYLDEHGFYAPSGDVTSFASCIATLLHDPERRTQLGKKLRQRAQEQYSWQRAGKLMIALYLHLTNDKQLI
jgi:glycosyltransferase involved in cell wall biosynthesis